MAHQTARKTIPVKHPGLFQITGRNVCAAFTTNHKGWVIETAPILRKELPFACSWMKVEEIINKHEWTIRQIEGESMGNPKPQYSIGTSVAIRKGKYVKGPSFGLWINDKSDFPMARGSVKENYLTELIEFLQKCEKRDLSASFALFKNKKEKHSDDDGDSEWSSKKDKDSDDDFDMPKKKSKREEPEDEDEKPSKKSSSKSSKSSGKEGKKSGSDWDFNDDD